MRRILIYQCLHSDFNHITNEPENHRAIPSKILSLPQKSLYILKGLERDALLSRIEYLLSKCIEASGWNRNSVDELKNTSN